MYTLRYVIRFIIGVVFVLMVWYLCVTYLPVALRHIKYMARLAWSDLHSYIKKAAEFIKNLKGIDVALEQVFSRFFC